MTTAEELPSSDDTVVKPGGEVDVLQTSALPQGSDLTTETDYDVEVKVKAYDMFLHSDADFTDIAIALSVPRNTVLTWSRKGKWNDRKQELELEAFKAAETQYRRFLTEHKLPTIERHLRVATMLEEEVENILKDAKVNKTPLDSMVLRRISEALASSAGVSARASGVNDRGLQTDDDGGGGGDGSGKQRKIPLVIINTGEGPQLSASQGEIINSGKLSAAIDVTEVSGSTTQ